MCGNAEGRLASGKKELVRPLSLDPATAQAGEDKPKLHEGDLYLCRDSKDALEGALGAVCQGVESVLDDSITKRAFVCIRPPGHHCSSDYPSGFCWLNNVHVGISHAAQQHGLTHAAIVDFDLHHGDGSQAVTWAHNTKVATLSKNTPMSKKTAIGYFSLHDINSYPCESGDEDKVRNASLCIENAHGQNIWNVHLQPWSTLEEFWALYEDRYLILLQKARTFLRQHSDRLRASSIHPPPKAIIFLSAGFDASEWESSYMQRHKVNVPTDFYARFTRDVVRLSEEEGLGVDGRVVSVLEGGYSDRALTSGVLSHLSGLTSSVSRPGSSGSSNGLGQEMGKRLGRLNLDNEVKREPAESNLPTANELNTDWWEPSQLDALEKLVNPPSAPAPPKKARNTLNPTFISQTQASAAKIVSPPGGRRSLSGSGTGFHSLQSTLPPLPEAPPPPVDWATAAHELAKLLIPTDRQTHSCKPEELNAEASRIRRDRHSAIGLPATMEEIPIVDAKRMQLRDRKGKSPKYTSEDEEKPAPSRASRRRTVDPATLAQDNITEEVPSKPVSKAPRRRLSVASSVSSVAAERPSTAGSISSGAAPAVPTMTGINPLPVRKTRSPSKPRATGTTTVVGKPRVTKKVPPVPRVPSDLSRPAAPPSRSSNHLNGLPSSVPLAENDDKKNQDIDSLASGMKKMTIKLGVPKHPQVSTNDGEVPKLKKETASSATTGNVKKKPAARGRPPKTSTDTISTSEHKATVDQVPKSTKLNPLSSLAEENHGLPNAALETQAPGESEAVALGMSTDATTTGEQGNEKPKALVTSLVDLLPGEVAMGGVHGSVAMEETVDPRQISTNSYADRISDREAEFRSDREELPSSPPLRSVQEQGFPQADFQRSSIGSTAGVDGKPGAFAAPENPTIPAEVPLTAEPAPSQGFSSQSTVNDGNIGPALFSTAPSSQAIQDSQSLPDDHDVRSEQYVKPSFEVIHPPSSSHPSTAAPTAASTIASTATSSATTPKRSQTRDNLPVWTSNSTIPFANNNTLNNTFTHTPSSYQLQQEASEAPSQQQHQHQDIKRDKRLEIGNLVDPAIEATAGVGAGKEHDLWEVPETPEHRKR